jgi:hypothetical protein
MAQSGRRSSEDLLQVHPEEKQDDQNASGASIGPSDPGGPPLGGDPPVTRQDFAQFQEYMVSQFKKEFKIFLRRETKGI